MSQTPGQALAYKPNTRQTVCLAKKTGAVASAYAAAGDNGLTGATKFTWPQPIRSATWKCDKQRKPNTDGGDVSRDLWHGPRAVLAMASAQHAPSSLRAKSICFASMQRGVGRRDEDSQRRRKGTWKIRHYSKRKKKAYEE